MKVNLFIYYILNVFFIAMLIINNFRYVSLVVSSLLEESKFRQTRKKCLIPLSELVHKVTTASIFTHLNHQINIKSEFFNNIRFSKILFLKTFKKPNHVKTHLNLI